MLISINILKADNWFKFHPESPSNTQTLVCLFEFRYWLVLKGFNLNIHSKKWTTFCTQYEIFKKQRLWIVNSWNFWLISIGGAYFIFDFFFECFFYKLKTNTHVYLFINKYSWHLFTLMKVYIFVAILENRRFFSRTLPKRFTKMIKNLSCEVLFSLTISFSHSFLWL